MPSYEAVLSDWATPPGATIAQLLSDAEISLSSFQESIGFSEQDVARLLRGDIVVDSLTAQDLARIVGGSTNFWLKREDGYREAVEQCKRVEPASWLTDLPLREMKAWGWISRSKNDMCSALDFFGVDSPRSWYLKYNSELGEVAFRKSRSMGRMGPISAWLRRAELIAAEVECTNWNASRFVASLELCKRLTTEREPAVFMPELQRICASAGVAVVFARAPTGSGISGATRFLSSNKAMLCLSFRHLSDDHLWFTFFHEAGHLLLHGEGSTILEADESGQAQQREVEANQFARDFLVPSEYRARLVAARNSRFEIARLARKLGVSPGILVGQLQKDGAVGFNRMNRMKRRYSWANHET